MKHIKTTILLILGIISAEWAVAQGPGGGQGRPGGQGGQGFQRRSPAEMVEMEKAMVIDSISSLNDDQKMILDAIYDEFAASLKTVFESSQGNREGMREKMQAVRTTKDESLKELFTEEQFTRYQQLMKNRRGRRGQGGQRGGGRRQRGGQPNN